VSLAGGDRRQRVGGCLDLALVGRRVQLGVGVGADDLVLGRNASVVGGAAGAGWWPVVFSGSPSRRRGPWISASAVARRRSSGHERLQRPDPVQQQELGGRVLAVVADHSAYDGPVLLFHVRAVVAAPWMRAGEGDLPLLTAVEQVVVEELATVVGIDADGREHMISEMCSSSAMTRRRALLRTERFSVRPVAISVTVRV
jgi:hypothetical protein